MLKNQTFGRCAVCESADLEIDDGGYVYCALCGAKEDADGRFLPVRMAERDYHTFARTFEQCPYCGLRQTRRDTDDFLYCFSCKRIVVLPAPQSWFPPGAVCNLGFRCELIGIHAGPRSSSWAPIEAEP
jgi:ribosomal protein L37AE/L43A